MDANQLEYAFDLLGGMLIGIALLGQFFVNKSIAEIAIYDSLKRKLVAYSIRIGAAIISFAVLVLVIKAIRSTTSVTVFSVAAISVGLLTTIIIGRKVLTKYCKDKNARNLSKA